MATDQVAIILKYFKEVMKCKKISHGVMRPLSHSTLQSVQNESDSKYTTRYAINRSIFHSSASVRTNVSTRSDLTGK